MIVGQLEPDAVVHQADVDARLHLRGALGLEAVIPQARGTYKVAERDPRLVAAVGRGGDPAEEPDRVRGAGLETGRPIGDPEPEPVERVHLGEEGLVRNQPGDGRLRVGHCAEVPAERAVLVAADRARDEQPVAESEHFFDVGAERDGLVRLLNHVAVGRGVGERLPPGRQALAAGLRPVQPIVEVLHSHRGL